MQWLQAADVKVSTEPKDTSFAGSPPDAVFLYRREPPYLVGIEGTVDELRALAQRFSDAVARLD